MGNLKNRKMGDKIESHYQSGGITAKNVTIREQQNVTNYPEKKKRKSKNKLIGAIVTIILVTAAIATILWYFNIKPE